MNGLDYLIVDEFLTDVAGCRALLTAFETGLIDCLAQVPNAPLPKFEAKGLAVLLALLEGNRVITRRGDEVTLQPRFQQALTYRDLLLTKLELAHLLSTDFIDHFTTLIQNPAEFFHRSRVFDLFGYHRCFELTPENIKATSRWMRWTSTLTKYEAPAIFAAFDWSQHRGMWVDVGGNSGEFAKAGYVANKQLAPVVFDLPVVCHVGMEQLRALPGEWPIGFCRANAVTDPFPPDAAIVSFKSMLHDWPDEQVSLFLQKAVTALIPGGTLLIVEREQLPIVPNIPFGQLPMFLFFRSFRQPAFYVQQLNNLGLENVQVRRLLLESPFMILTAQKR